MTDDRQHILVTHETKTKHTHAVDGDVAMSAATGEGTVTIRSREQLAEIANAVRATQEHFSTISKRIMNAEKAAFVRKLREDGHSWRSLADECYNRWKVSDTEDEWYPSSNQLMGMALCEVAAHDFYGQHFMKDEPWI